MVSAVATIDSGVAQRAVALAIQPALDPIALAVEILGQGVLPVGRRDHRKQVELEVDHLTASVEAAVVAPRLPDGRTAVMSRVFVVAMVMAMTWAPFMRLGGPGQGERREAEPRRGERALPHLVRFAILRMHRMVLLVTGLLPHSKSEDLSSSDSFRAHGAVIETSKRPPQRRRGARTPGHAPRKRSLWASERSP